MDAEYRLPFNAWALALGLFLASLTLSCLTALAPKLLETYSRALPATSLLVDLSCFVLAFGMMYQTVRIRRRAGRATELAKEPDEGQFEKLLSIGFGELEGGRKQAVVAVLTLCGVAFFAQFIVIVVETDFTVPLSGVLTLLAVAGHAVAKAGWRKLRDEKAEVRVHES